MQKIRKGKSLDRSIEQFPEDGCIRYCTMHGPIHYSFCVYCPDYTGKEQLGDRNGRKPSHCILAGPMDLGRVKDGEITFADQGQIDGFVNKDLGVLADPARRITVPFDENDIKSAFNTDVPIWDWLRHSYYFCFRCGPAATGEVHFRCQSCGDRNICSNCAEDWSQQWSADGSRTVSFKCPACEAGNQFDLGVADVHAGKFKDRRPENRLRWMKEAFVPVLFDWLDIMIKGEEAIATASDANRRRPSPDAEAVEIQDSWLVGEYWIDRVQRRAWLESSDSDWMNHLFARTPHGLILTNFDFDLVLSYRTGDLTVAQDIRQLLAKAGHSVFLMEAGLNIWDRSWPLRFSQAISRARHLAILGTEAFFDGEATKLELDELDRQARIRGKLGISDAPVWAVLPEEETQRHLDHASALKICNIQQLAKILGETEPVAASAYRPNVVEVEPIKYDPAAPCCPECGARVFFDERDVPWPNERLQIASENAALALTCVNGHRYCNSCDASSLGGLTDCCPICYAQYLGSNRNVAGRRTPSALYFSGISTASVYLDFNPDKPICLKCGTLFSEKTIGLACRFGHRVCTTCSGSEDHRCRQCSEEVPGRISLAAAVPMAAYFHQCKDVRPIRPEHDPGGQCDWCDKPDRSGQFVRFDRMGRACSSCLQAAHVEISRESRVFGGTDWGGLQQRLVLGASGKSFKEATCGACWKPPEGDNIIVTGIIEGYAIEAIWAICTQCVEDAQRALGPASKAR